MPFHLDSPRGDTLNINLKTNLYSAIKSEDSDALMPLTACDGLGTEQNTEGG